MILRLSHQNNDKTTKTLAYLNNNKAFKFFFKFKLTQLFIRYLNYYLKKNNQKMSWNSRT